MSATTRRHPRGHRGRRGRRGGDRRLGRPGRDLLAAAHPGPEGHPRLGPRLRRRRDAARRPRVGRARGDPVADHPGGREDRAVRLRRPGAVLRRPHRPGPADRQRGAVLGRRRHRHVDHGHRARRSPRSSGRARASRSASGSRAASAPPTTSRWRRSAPRSPTPARTCRTCARARSSTRRRTSG